jgi:hypothetical protein|tara:strand:- start:514 stop:798 length:285 start_codon:yes stop_codon:yes gene_type:complete
MPSVHKKKTFETLQEQVKRWSDLELKAYPHDGLLRENPFSGERSELSGQEAAVFDLIWQIQIDEFVVRNAVKVFDMMRYWFMEHNSDAYSTLLD